MELLLILTYSAICVAVFKIFRIPVNKWTLPTAALGGIFHQRCSTHHELQPPLYEQCADLFRNHSDNAKF